MLETTLDRQVRFLVETENLKTQVEKLSVEPHLAFSKQCPPDVVDVVMEAMENQWLWIAHPSLNNNAD